MKLETFQFWCLCQVAYVTLSRQFHQRYLKIFTFHDLGRIHFADIYPMKGHRDNQNPGPALKALAVQQLVN